MNWLHVFAWSTLLAYVLHQKCSYSGPKICEKLLNSLNLKEKRGESPLTPPSWKRIHTKISLNRNTFNKQKVWGKEDGGSSCARETTKIKKCMKKRTPSWPQVCGNLYMYYQMIWDTIHLCTRSLVKPSQKRDCSNSFSVHIDNPMLHTLMLALPYSTPLRLWFC